MAVTWSRHSCGERVNLRSPAAVFNTMARTATSLIRAVVVHDERGDTGGCGVVYGGVRGRSTVTVRVFVWVPFEALKATVTLAFT